MAPLGMIESHDEEATLARLAELGYEVAYGPDVEPEKLARRLRAARRESARAKMRVMVKRLLRKYGYPPDRTEHATQLVLAQVEVVCEEWAA